MFQSLRSRRTVALLLLACLFVVIVLPRDAYAQDAADLIVSILDEHNNPVAATIVVRDRAGMQNLARTTTDAHGIATIATLSMDEIRVAVEGILPDGTRLFQRGDDVLGMYLLLDAGSTRLDLRVEPDGAVLPDPATMVAQEGTSYDGVALPTVPVAAPLFASPTSSQPTMPRLSDASERPATTSTEQPAKSEFPLASIALVALLALGIAGVLLVQRKV